MSFTNNNPELVEKMTRARTSEDPDLAALATAKVAQIIPMFTNTWCSMQELTMAVGAPPMAQRYQIFKAASTILIVAEQTYKVNTIAERAALNNSLCDDDFYINTLLVLALKKIKECYTNPNNI